LSAEAGKICKLVAHVTSELSHTILQGNKKEKQGKEEKYVKGKENIEARRNAKFMEHFVRNLKEITI
jgi:hypothetical protein